MPALVPWDKLIGCKLSDFFVEKHEYPAGSNNLSEFPVAVWVITQNRAHSVRVSAGPNGASIRMEFGNPKPIDMGEYGSIVLLPQFLEKDVRAKTVVSAGVETLGDGETLSLLLSDGSMLEYACNGDDELRPSFDQSAYYLDRNSFFTTA